MGDLAALQYLAVGTPGGCQELWNQRRLAAYLSAGLSPAGFTIHATPCNGLDTLLQGDEFLPPQYIDPELDDAPWWDPHPDVRTRARRFAGVLPIEVTGLDSDMSTVDTVATADGGAVFVNRRDLPRDITVRAMLVGLDCCATRYGLEWLKLALSDASCGGTGGELTYLSCCPPSELAEFCADSTGECDPETDPDCIEMDCEDEPEVYDLSATEWWRSLLGVMPTRPVTVTSKLGGDCGCGGSEVMEVTFGFTTGNARPWRQLVTAADHVLFSPLQRHPTYRFRKRPTQTVTRQRTRERRELKAVLRGNRWCPVGGWTAGEAQSFGGEGYVTIQEAVASNAKEFTATDSACDGGGNQKRAHQLRVVWDELLSQLRFETVRWVNNSWNTADPMAAVPCDTPIDVIELVHIHQTPTGPEGALETVSDVSAPGDGDDCCFIWLDWTASNGGNWGTFAGASDGSDASPWAAWGIEGAAPSKSGWPPVGCKVVVGRNCPPSTADADVCPESTDCPISLNADGTWAAGTGTPAFNAFTFPPVQCKFVIAGQTTAPIVETVTEVAYGSCPQGCEPEVDPLEDPAAPREAPPTPPVSGGKRCLPATRVETTMRWADNRQWDTVVPVIEFYSGRVEAVGVEILVWANPLGVNPTDPTSRSVFLDCNACGVWSLSRVPPGTTIRVDGRLRRVMALVPGGKLIHAGQLLESRDNRPLAWPQVDGCGLVAAVRVGATGVDFAESWSSLMVAGSGS